jgi:hypothetical protein
MDIVLPLLVAYVLAGLIWSQIVRNRQLFLSGAAAVAVAMALSSLPVFFFARLSEAVAFVVLVLAGNDIPLREWKRLFSW